ncbi:MAG: hypothetical protein C0623_10255 [Desulfuromonas sp.]|nr:MAG: hypothetical protein C0623_10255 [Desulfuromonas sp.]
MSENEERLTNLELKFMDQSQLLEELSHELAFCHKRIEELTREHRSMQEMMKSLEPENQVSPDE